MVKLVAYEDNLIKLFVGLLLFFFFFFSRIMQKNKANTFIFYQLQATKHFFFFFWFINQDTEFLPAAVNLLQAIRIACNQTSCYLFTYRQLADPSWFSRLKMCPWVCQAWVCCQPGVENSSSNLALLKQAWRCNSGAWPELFYFLILN